MPFYFKLYTFRISNVKLLHQTFYNSTPPPPLWKFLDTPPVVTSGSLKSDVFLAVFFVIHFCCFGTFHLVHTQLCLLFRPHPYPFFLHVIRNRNV